eukprot:3203521-Rhodomonas_salina.2
MSAAYLPTASSSFARPPPFLSHLEVGSVVFSVHDSELRNGGCALQFGAFRYSIFIQLARRGAFNIGTLSRPCGLMRHSTDSTVQAAMAAAAQFHPHWHPAHLQDASAGTFRLRSLACGLGVLS